MANSMYQQGSKPQLAPHLHQTWEYRWTTFYSHTFAFLAFINVFINIPLDSIASLDNPIMLQMPFHSTLISQFPHLFLIIKSIIIHVLHHISVLAQVPYRINIMFWILSSSPLLQILCMKFIMMILIDKYFCYAS